MSNYDIPQLTALFFCIYLKGEEGGYNAHRSITFYGEELQIKDSFSLQSNLVNKI